MLEMQVQWAIYHAYTVLNFISSHDQQKARCTEDSSSVVVVPHQNFLFSTSHESPWPILIKLSMHDPYDKGVQSCGGGHKQVNIYLMINVSIM